MIVLAAAGGFAATLPGLRRSQGNRAIAGGMEIEIAWLELGLASTGTTTV